MPLKQPRFFFSKSPHPAIQPFSPFFVQKHEFHLKVTANDGDEEDNELRRRDDNAFDYHHKTTHTRKQQMVI